MKNILLVMPYGSVGGMERLALTFYDFYKNQGYEVKALKFIKLDNDIINFGEDELFFKGHDFSSMSKIERALFYCRAPKLMRSIIRRYQITHSIAFGDMANLFSSLTFTNEFKIGSIHALKSAEFSNKTLFNRIFKFGYQSSYKYMDKVVCISKAIKEDLIIKCGYKFSNLEIIYNPHDISEITRLSKEKINDKDEIEIFSNKTILFLGRLSIQKAPWHLLNAFSLFTKENPEVNLVFIGDGDQRVINRINDLIKTYKLEKKVFLLGRRSNPYKYLSSADVLALSSYYEGTPNVIVEAIALGTPIVSSYCTRGIVELMSTQDYLEQNKNLIVESGIITPNFFKGILEIPKNNLFIDEEKMFCKALSIILNDKKSRLRLEKSRLQLLSKFDLQNVASNYLKD